MRHGSVRQGEADNTADAGDPDWADGLYRADDGTPSVPRQPAPPGSGHRAGNTGRAANRRRKKGKKGKRKIFRYVAITTSLLILVTAGAGWA